MKTIRMIVMGLMALVCITGFVACGGDDDDPTTPPTDGPSTPSTEKTTSLTVTYHLLLSESMYKYATVQVLDGSNNVVKTLTAADFKACTSTDMIPSSFDNAKEIVGSYLSKGDSIYYDYSFQTTYTTFPFSDAYKLKATPVSDMTGAPAKTNVLMNCQYITYTGKGTFKFGSFGGHPSMLSGLKMDKWSNALTTSNPFNSVSISCDANGTLNLN